MPLLTELWVARILASWFVDLWAKRKRKSRRKRRITSGGSLVGFCDDDGVIVVGAGGRKSQTDGGAVLFEFEGFFAVVREQVGTLDGRFEAVDGEATVSRPIEDVEEKAVTFLGDASPGGCRVEGTGGGAVNGIAVTAHPAANFLEDADGAGGNGAFGGWADVEEIIAAFAGDVGEVADNFAGGFEVMVVFVVAPMPIEGHADLERIGGALAGNFLFGRAVVGGDAEAIIDETLRLQFVD